MSAVKLISSDDSTARSTIALARLATRHWKALALCGAIVSGVVLVAASAPPSAQAHAAEARSVMRPGDDAVAASKPQRSSGKREESSASTAPRDRRPGARDWLLGLQSGAVSFEALATLLSRDWQVREELQRLYLIESDPAIRQQLLGLLAEGPPSEVLAFSERLLADADGQRRADGYALINAVGLSDERARTRVLAGLREETDVDALTALIGGLQHGLLAAEEADELAVALSEFERHADARLRALTLPQLAQWRDAGDLEQPFYRALLDQNADVRGAAIAGISIAQVRSPRLQEALFGIASDPRETPEHRLAALQALLRFRMSRSEVELYRALEREVPLHPGRG